MHLSGKLTALRSCILVSMSQALGGCTMCISCVGVPHASGSGKPSGRNAVCAHRLTESLQGKDGCVQQNGSAVIQDLPKVLAVVLHNMPHSLHHIHTKRHHHTTHQGIPENAFPPKATMYKSASSSGMLSSGVYIMIAPRCPS